MRGGRAHKAGDRKPSWRIAHLLSGVKFCDMGAPILNDVATDLASPPEFVKKTSLNPFPEAFKKPIADYYTSLKPLNVPRSRQETFKACLRATKKMPRWTIEHEDIQTGIIEGFARTKLLRFKDDFVIRLSASDDSQTIVDMRSKSRSTPWLQHKMHTLLWQAVYYGVVQFRASCDRASFACFSSARFASFCVVFEFLGGGLKVSAFRFALRHG